MELGVINRALEEMGADGDAIQMFQPELSLIFSLSKVASWDDSVYAFQGSVFFRFSG